MLAAAAIAVLGSAPAAPVSAVGAPVNVCVSDVPCLMGCSAGDIVRVNVVGYGYGDAMCGDAFAWCETGSDLDTCSGGSLTFTGSSTMSCRVDGYGSLPVIAICTSMPHVE